MARKKTAPATAKDEASGCRKDVIAMRAATSAQAIQAKGPCAKNEPAALPPIKTPAVATAGRRATPRTQRHDENSLAAIDEASDSHATQIKKSCEFRPFSRVPRRPGST